MSTFINQDKLESCQYLLHKLKFSIEHGTPITEYHRVHRYKYYWSDCHEFNLYVNKINEQKHVKVESSNIYRITTSVNQPDKVTTYQTNITLNRNNMKNVFLI